MGYSVFLSVHQMIPRDSLLDCMKQTLTSEAFEAFNHGSIFYKAVFCLGEEQGMLINDECIVDREISVGEIFRWLNFHRVLLSSL